MILSCSQWSPPESSATALGPSGGLCRPRIPTQHCCAALSCPQGLAGLSFHSLLESASASPTRRTGCDSGQAAVTAGFPGPGLASHRPFPGTRSHGGTFGSHIITCLPLPLKSFGGALGTHRLDGRCVYTRDGGTRVRVLGPGLGQRERQGVPGLGTGVSVVALGQRGGTRGLPLSLLCQQSLSLMLSELLSCRILGKGDFSTPARAGKGGDTLGEASGSRSS